LSQSRSDHRRASRPPEYSVHCDGQGHWAASEEHSPCDVAEIGGRLAGVLDQATYYFRKGHARQIGAEAVMGTRSEREQTRRVGLFEAVEDEIVRSVPHQRIAIGRRSGEAHERAGYPNTPCDFN